MKTRTGPNHSLPLSPAKVSPIGVLRSIPLVSNVNERFSIIYLTRYSLRQLSLM
ncbi:MAG: hypothetical protein NTW21_15410 [Verrucomicrobia bacterium]|nr:hypothetical protein [Verrucomicrobiota bacterium]